MQEANPKAQRAAPALVRARRALAMKDDSGAITAEYVVVLPAVLLVLMLVIGGIMVSAQRLVLTSAAAQIARLEARGEIKGANARLGHLPSGVQISRELSGEVRCVTLSWSPELGLLSQIHISATGCAAEHDNGKTQ